jgi:hypothetical protein
VIAASTETPRGERAHAVGAHVAEGHYAGSYTKGLVSTGAWKSEQSASRYAHAVVSEEATKASLLPFEESVENGAEKKKA